MFLIIIFFLNEHFIRIFHVETKIDLFWKQMASESNSFVGSEFFFFKGWNYQINREEIANANKIQSK